MINEYYSKLTYIRLKKTKSKFLSSSIIIFCFGVAFVGFSAFFIKPSNVNIIKIIDSLIASISFVSTSFLIIEGYLPTRAKTNMLYRLLTVDRYEGEVLIISIHKPYLIRKGLRAYEIECLDNDDKKFICYLEEGQKYHFKEGNKYTLIFASSFIVGIKEGVIDE